MEDELTPEWVPCIGETCHRNFHITVRRNRTQGAEEENRTTVTINTADPDRHGTIIDPQGGDFGNYRNNNVVLINHDHNLLATSATVSLRDGKIEANINDEDWDLDDPEIARWHRKLKSGLLKATSVGIIVKAWEWNRPTDGGGFRPLTDDESPNWQDDIIRITEWELLEFSFVSVPSNPNALVTSRMANKTFTPAARPQPADAPEPKPVAEEREASGEVAAQAPAPRAAARMTESQVEALIQRIVSGTESRIEDHIKRKLGKR